MGRGRFRNTVGEPRPTRIFDAMEITAILGADQRNRWIAWDEIQHATIKLGIIDHSLHVVLTNGRRAKFLWLQVDGGYDELEAAVSGRRCAPPGPSGRTQPWRARTHKPAASACDAADSG